MKIATTIGEVYKYEPIPANALRCYQGTGFRYFDYNFYTVHTGNSPFLQDSDKEWKQQVEDAGNAAADYGFKFVQAHAPGYNPLGKADDHQACLRTMYRSVEACGMLGIPTIVVHGSMAPYYVYPMDSEAFFKYTREFLSGMLDAAEKYGVTICVENSTSKWMRDMYYPRTAAEMNAWVEYMDHPLLKCCWDTGHSLLEGKTDQYDEIKTLGDNLKAVHIHDNDGLYDEHIAPYCGIMKMDPFIQALKEIDFRGYFTFESDAFMNKVNGDGPASKLPLELRQEALALLYKTGKFMLESHNAFEE